MIAVTHIACYKTDCSIRLFRIAHFIYKYLTSSRWTGHCSI